MSSLRVQKNTNGFALILALLVSSVALAIGLSLLDVTVKQLSLTSTVRESEIAFQAAAAGMNCVQTARNRYVYQTQDNGAPAFSMECLNQAITMSDNLPLNPRTQRFESQIDWVTPAGASICIQMELMVLNAAEPSAAAVTNQSARNGNQYSCAAGNICTFAFSRGYNRSCTAVSSGALYTVQREITAEF